MDSSGRKAGYEDAIAGTPEDVAALYLWANLQGAKYRDFSASRREYRAQVRYRASQALRERELRAQAAAEAAVEAAQRAESAALAAARLQDADDNRELQILLLQDVEEAARTASAEREEAARRAEAVACATAVVLREEREIAEAQVSVRRQALRYAETDVRRLQLAGPQPRDPMDCGTMDSALALSEDLHSSATQVECADVERADCVGSHAGGDEAVGADRDAGLTGPAWLYGSRTPPQTRLLQSVAKFPVGETTEGNGEAPEGDTLQDSRERVASRWFAMKGVFKHAASELPAMPLTRAVEGRMPLLLVYSLAGGVGKTSLAATLGRALSLQGEKVVLTDTTSRGLLPYYFGERELRPGEVRTVQPPAGSPGVPLSLVTYDAASMGEDERQQESLTDEILRNGHGNQRVVLDLSSGSSWLVRRMVELHPIVLVPMTGDMNSVISLQAVERVSSPSRTATAGPCCPIIC